MTLRARIIAWNLAALALSLLLTLVVGGLNARQAVYNEVSSAMTGALKALEHAAADPQVVYAFDGSRHVRVSAYAPGGEHLTQSTVAVEPERAPAWVVRALDPRLEPKTLVRAGLRFRVEPIAVNEIHESWGHARDVALFPLLTAALLAAIIGLVIERALKPLRDLREGLAAIAAGDFRARVEEGGPPEMAELMHGFNRMGAKLASSEARNRALLRQLERVQEEERADIARDLHDEIGSHLFAASMDCAAIVRLADGGEPERLREQAEAVRSAVAHVQAHVRALLERLRADPALRLRLTEALRDLIEFWRLRAPQIAFETDLPPQEPEFDGPQVANLYRVTQEALTNAVRHGGATRVRVSLARIDANGWLLIISDNGEGGHERPVEPGFGLTGMRERTAAAGGTFEAGPAEDGGWTVRVRLPEPVAAAEGARLEDTAG